MHCNLFTIFFDFVHTMKRRRLLFRTSDVLRQYAPSGDPDRNYFDSKFAVGAAYRKKKAATTVEVVRRLRWAARVLSNVWLLRSLRTPLFGRQESRLFRCWRRQRRMAAVVGILCSRWTTHNRAVNSAANFSSDPNSGSRRIVRSGQLIAYNDEWKSPRYFSSRVSISTRRVCIF